MATRFLLATAEMVESLERELMAMIGLDTPEKRKAAKTTAYAVWQPPLRGNRGRRLGMIEDRHVARLRTDLRNRLKARGDPDLADWVQAEPPGRPRNEVE